MLRITLIGGLWWGRRYRFIVHRWRRSTGRVAGQGLSLPIHRICFFFFPPVVHFFKRRRPFLFIPFFLSFFLSILRSFSFPMRPGGGRHSKVGDGRSTFSKLPLPDPKLFPLHRFPHSGREFPIVPRFDHLVPAVTEFFLLGFHELIESLCFFSIFYQVSWVFT